MKKAKVLACFDGFKGTLLADKVAEAVTSKLVELYGQERLETRILSLSDGGGGFLAALRKPMDLEMVPVLVTGPLGDDGGLITAHYGRSEEERFKDVAVVEMANASGLHLVTPKEKLNPLNTTTKGTGELIKAAYEAGHRHIIVGMGGSATNDGGLGCLQALGLRVAVATEAGETTYPSVIYGRDLTRVVSLEMPTDREELLPGAVVEVACDVNNPFCGEKGAVATFARQKGANTKEILDELERGMCHIVPMLQRLPSCKTKDLAKLPGSGAAGGLAGGIVASTGATIKKGIEFVSQLLGLEEAIQQSDIIFTGEGSYDAQTAHGKVVSQVQLLANKHNKRVIIICGRKDIPPELDDHVYDCVSLYSTEESMQRPYECIQGLVEAKHHLFFLMSDASSAS
ncbi:Glycerate kinase [Balamuthia mandrillaris]